MHILHTFANNSSVPYLTWFAERAIKEGGIRYTYLIMHEDRPAMLDEMRERGFDCEWIPFSMHERKRGLIRALPALTAYMRKYAPDIVHCNLFDDTLPGLLAARLAGIHTRFTTRQDTGFHWAYARKWMLFDRINNFNSTHIIAISEECKRFLIEKEGVAPDKITLVHNGIPPERFTLQQQAVMERSRQRFKLEKNHVVVGTVARFIEWKGYSRIVQAAADLVKRHPYLRFLFCGEGVQKAEIQRMVRDHGLEDHVLFTGWIDRAEMPSFYGILDIYLHAARLEPFGLVYPEAMMNAVPVISTPTGAALDAIRDGANGILLKDDTAETIIEGMERMLKTDRQVLGEEGKRTAMSMYHFDVMYNGTINAYRKALELA